MNNITIPKDAQTIIDCLVKNAMQIQDNFLKLNSTLQMLIKEQKSTQLALDNIVLAIEQGVINKTTNKRMIDLETRLEELEKENFTVQQVKNIVSRINARTTSASITCDMRTPFKKELTN